MRVNNLDELYESNATTLSQLESWREKAIRRFNAGLISENTLTLCMRKIDRLEDDCESAELSLIGLNEKRIYKDAWVNHTRKEFMRWPAKKKSHGRGIKYAS